MNNLELLTIIIGVLSIYYISNSLFYWSLFNKTNEELELYNKYIISQDKMKDKYRDNNNKSENVLEDTNKILVGLKEEIQNKKIIRTEKKHKNKMLQYRIEEIYSNLGYIKG